MPKNGATNNILSWCKVVKPDEAWEEIKAATTPGDKLYIYEPEPDPNFMFLKDCQKEATQVGEYNGIPLVHVSFGEVMDLPAEEEGILLIVSARVRSALPFRKDLVSPGDLVRDESEIVIGCKTLIIN